MLIFLGEKDGQEMKRKAFCGSCRGEGASPSGRSRPQGRTNIDRDHYKRSRSGKRLGQRKFLSRDGAPRCWPSGSRHELEQMFFEAQARLDGKTVRIRNQGLKKTFDFMLHIGDRVARPMPEAFGRRFLFFMLLLR